MKLGTIPSFLSPMPPTSGVGEERMRQSYEIAGNLLRDSYRNAPEKRNLLNAISPQDLVVVDGCYDHMHLMLEAVRVPHTQVLPRQVDEAMLQSARAVFVNCGNSFPEPSAHRLARFVERGGLLLTTDWALMNVLEVAFPGYVSRNGRNTENDVVSVQVANRDIPMTRAFLRQDPPPAWWLEGSSLPLKRLSPQVEVLLHSREMRHRYGNGSIAVRFPYGEGKVYHMVSHFYLQQSDVKQPRHQESAVRFLDDLGDFSEETRTRVFRAEETRSRINYASLQSATASVAFVFETLFDHLGPCWRDQTLIERATGIFRMLMSRDDKKKAAAWRPLSPHFVWNGNMYEFRFPQQATQFTIGRRGEVMIADPKLSGRHATIQRLGARDYSLVAHETTIIHHGGNMRVLQAGESAWLLPGTEVVLTSEMRFVFSPQP